MKKGEKYIIEIAEVHTHYDDNGNKYPVARIKGFSALTFDQKGLDKLEVFEEGETRELLNCRFIVVSTTVIKGLTVGKTYEVKNGKFIDDDGKIQFPPDTRLHSFIELQNYLDIDSSMKDYYGGTTRIIRAVV